MAQKAGGGKMPNIPQNIPDEEIAYRIVKLYFEEVARMGFKRNLDLDSIINAYYYTLQRLHNKDKELKTIAKLAHREERTLSNETKEQLLPQFGEKKQVAAPATVIR